MMHVFIQANSVTILSIYCTEWFLQYYLFVSNLTPNIAADSKDVTEIVTMM